MTLSKDSRAPVVRQRLSRTPEYVAWCDMRHRCNNPNNRSYEDYGGRGITVDPAWSKFSVFLADMGLRPPNKSLDRKNVNLGYTPENCRWATRREQLLNRRIVKLYEFNGRSQPLVLWAEELGCRVGVLLNRLRAGWLLAEVLSRPKYPKRRHTPAQKRRQKAAKSYIEYEIRRGRLIRPSACPTCSCDKHILQAHHYKGHARKNWGVIQWLCPRCHKKAEATSPY